MKISPISPRSEDVEDDIYFHALQLITDLGFVGSVQKKFEALQALLESGRLLEVTTVTMPRGEKAIPPMRLLLGHCAGLLVGFAWEDAGWLIVSSWLDHQISLGSEA